MPEPSFVTRPSISAQILPRLRQDIVEGRWAPGERLPEPLLCGQFGISRTPLRDAFRVLEAEGLVQLVPNVGALVSQPCLQQLQGCFEILALLEAGAAEQVAAGRPPQVLQRLRRLTEEMGEADRAAAAPDYFLGNDAFHRAIVEGAGNPVLAGMHEQLMLQINRLRFSYYRRQLAPARTGRGHDEILALLEQGAPAAAFASMREHVRDVARRMLALAARIA